MISTSKLQLSELIVYLNDSNLAQRELLPLNRNRVLSLMKNPRADNQDIVVYVAYSNSLPIGYRIILPDTININSNTIKIAWLSASWVHPDFRRKGIASLLLKEVVKDWDENVITNNFAPLAKLLYNKSDLFCNLFTATGKRYYLRKTMLKDYNTCNYNSNFDKFKEAFINFFNISKLLRQSLQLPKNIEIEYFTHPDKGMIKMFNASNQNTLTQRNEEEWNWMLRYPWLQGAPLGDRITPKYFFASSPPVFNQYLLKVFNNDELIGMLHIQHSHTRLTIPYSYFEPMHSEIMARIVLLHAHKLKATFITTYNQNLINGLDKLKRYFMYTQKRTREFLTTKSLKNKIGSASIIFSDGDGDCGFI